MGRQDRSKRAQDPLKTAQKPPKTLQRGPKSPQERPKTPPRRPKNPPRSPLGTVLESTWDRLITRSISRRSRVNWCKLFGSILEPKMPPKTTPRRPKRVKIQDETCITFLSLLDSSWTGLEAILRPSWGNFGAFRIGFSNVF